MTKNNKKGFTIIEVVLVLAIAGLIFLMVFIALPALQRSQRNTRRRQDMARILSAFNDYQANNNGKMPADAKLADFITKYVDEDCVLDTTTTGMTKFSKCADQFTDPDGTPYSIKQLNTTGGADWTSGSVSWPNGHLIGYWTGAVCSETEGKNSPKTGQNNIAIMYVLEGGAIYCGDNQ